MIKICLLLLLVFSSSLKPSEGVEISFKNDSAEDFKELTVTVSKKKYTFANIRKGETTKPIKAKETYWFCLTTAITERDTVLFSGFCTVGETLVKDGSIVVSYSIYPKNGEHRLLIANEVLYSGSAKNVGFAKLKE
jgi:hypothetical protein